MNFEFDLWGWYAGQLNQSGPRTTDVAPTNLSITSVEGEPRSNWNGVEWLQLPYAEPVPIEEPLAEPNPTEWLIDIGPFFDRFGPAKLAVLTSTDPGVRAILTDTQVRKWITLNLPEVGQSVAYIGTKVPTVTAEMQERILNTPVDPAENLALRKLYFS